MRVTAVFWRGYLAVKRLRQARRGVVGAQAVAHPANRLDPLAGATQLAAQALDVGLDRPRVGIQRMIPHLAQQLLAGAHVAPGLERNASSRNSSSASVTSRS